MSLDEKIISLRKKEGLTQEQLAEQLRVTRQTISKWELGQSTPDLNYISQLSDIFHVSTDYLIKEEQETVSQTVRQSTPVEMTSTVSRISPLQIVGIILASLGGVLLVVGMIMSSSNGDCILAIIAGVLLLISGLEFIVVKRHPVLVVFWTLWVFLMPYPVLYGLNNIASFGGGFFTMGGIVAILTLLFLVVLIITTVFTCRRSKKKR